MLRLLFAAVVVVLASTPLAAQQPTPREFSKPVYDATACVSMFQQVVASRPTVYARNDCGREVRMLGCYRVTREGPGFSRVGWYCDYTSYRVGHERIVAQMGAFDPRLKWAACFTPNPACDQRLASIHSLMRTKGADPEEVARALP